MPPTLPNRKEWSDLADELHNALTTAEDLLDDLDAGRFVHPAWVQDALAHVREAMGAHELMQDRISGYHYPILAEMRTKRTG